MALQTRIVISARDLASPVFGRVAKGSTVANAQVMGFARSMDMATSSLANFSAGIAAFAAASGIAAIVRTKVEFDRITNTLEAVSGSTQVAGREMRFLSSTAEDLGIDLIALSKSYASVFAAGNQTALSTEQIRDIFLSLSEAGTTLGLRTDEMNGIFTAVEQIMSKNIVSAEELRQQLGERLPGAMAVAAKAIGVTGKELQDLLKQGALTADEFLPKFAAELRKTFGPGAAKGSQLLIADIRRLGNAFDELKLKIADSGLGRGLQLIAKELTRILRSDAVINGLKALGKGFEFLAENAKLAIGVLTGLGTIALGRFLSTASTVLFGFFAGPAFRNTFVQAGLTAGVVFARFFGRALKSIPILGSIAGGLGVLSRGIFNLIPGFGALTTAIGLATGSLILFKDEMVEINGTQFTVGEIATAAFQQIKSAVQGSFGDLRIFAAGLMGFFESMGQQLKGFTNFVIGSLNVIGQAFITAGNIVKNAVKGGQGLVQDVTAGTFASLEERLRAIASQDGEPTFLQKLGVTADVAKLKVLGLGDSIEGLENRISQGQFGEAADLAGDAAINLAADTQTLLNNAKDDLTKQIADFGQAFKDALTKDFVGEAADTAGTVIDNFLSGLEEKLKANRIAEAFKQGASELQKQLDALSLKFEPVRAVQGAGAGTGTQNPFASTLAFTSAFTRRAFEDNQAQDAVARNTNTLVGQGDQQISIGQGILGAIQNISNIFGVLPAEGPVPVSPALDPNEARFDNLEGPALIDAIDNEAPFPEASNVPFPAQPAGVSDVELTEMFNRSIAATDENNAKLDQMIDLLTDIKDKETVTIEQR